MVDGVAAGAELDVQGSQAGGGGAVVDGDGVDAAAGIVGAGVEREIGDGGEGDGFKGGAAANAGNARLACAGAVEGERIADGLGAADENDIAGGEGCAVGEINNQLVVTVVAVEGKAGGIGGECIRG